MASRILSRVAATALVLAAGGLVSANAAATGAPAVTVATDVVYGIGGPDTPLPVAITTSADAASIVVTAGGLIADAVCTGPVLLAVDLGELVITPDPGPAIPAADKALETGNPQELVKLIDGKVHDGIHKYFVAASVQPAPKSDI